MTALPRPAPEIFTSPGGRDFTLEVGARSPDRYEGDPLWTESWTTLYQGERAGTLFRSSSYGPELPWTASTRKLYWSHAEDAPTGIGFDVAAFATAQECLAAWCRSADQILDWSQSAPVKNIYSKTGVSLKGV